MQPFSSLSSAWTFLRKQPVLLPVALWMGAIPYTIIDLLSLAQAPADPLVAAVMPIALATATCITALWTQAAILLVARRMHSNKAGRARTSLRAVAMESVRFVPSLLLATVLWLSGTIQRGLLYLLPLLGITLLQPGMCTVASTTAGTLKGCPPLWLLSPLLLPAAAFAVQRVLYDVTLMLENVRGRDALRRSRELTTGRTVQTAGTLLLLAACLVLPAQILASLLLTAADGYPILLMPAILMGNLLREIGALLLSLSLVAYYKHLRSARAADAVHTLQSQN